MSTAASGLRRGRTGFEHRLGSPRGSTAPGEISVWRPGMKAQPCWVPCQIQLQVGLNPLPAVTSVLSRGKLLLHPRQHLP